MNELALFAGAGGGILGGKLLGWKTVCAVELNDYARSVLIARQNERCLEPFPIWDDVRTFDGKPWRGLVDIITGGFPCQDISVAGGGEGLDGERSGLWREMRRIVGEVGPRNVLVENSPALTFRGLGTVLGDLAALGYDARWGVLGANHAGAPHKRERIWIVADAGGFGLSRAQTVKQVGRRLGLGVGGLASEWWRGEPGETPREIERPVGRVAHGVASRVDRLRCLGNGQVPAVVRLAWETLSESPMD
jgi:DNA (cytosine-5)-methyltransferase 1